MRRVAIQGSCVVDGIRTGKGVHRIGIGKKCRGRTYPVSPIAGVVAVGFAGKVVHGYGGTSARPVRCSESLQAVAVRRGHGVVVCAGMK